MATKGMSKNKLEANEAFLQYEEEIAAHPAYAGMPDLRHDDGSIQWEAPSNRGPGKFQFTHDKRLQWWKAKAAEVGISTEESKWISKVAKMIHPTKLHPCKVCGRVMDIRYCYLSADFMKRVKKLSFYDDSVEMDEITHILDFVATFVDTYGDAAYAALPTLLKCAQMKKVPPLPNDLAVWTEWIDREYIPLEPSMLGPGSMANPPDRLDGFHTYNRCCRPTADTGRSKQNLASYSTDRRAFENWSDGNWIIANKLMGYISSNPGMRREPCAKATSGGHHPRPCSADHVGPISLGFCHRPEFQLLCTPCNSGKNNRMYYSDVTHLIEVEKAGEVVVTWYANAIWQRCKKRVSDQDSADRLSRVMRDNRNIALMLLNEFLERRECLFLLTLMNLNYADYQYDIVPNSLRIDKQIVTVEFTKKPSALRYVAVQKTRKIRVAFSALEDYANKENRNGYMYTSPEIERLKSVAFAMLAAVDNDLKEKNRLLIQALSSGKRVGAQMERFLSSIEYASLQENETYGKVKQILEQVMGLVADELASNWDNSRYARD